MTRRWIAAAALCVAFAIVHTWPLALAPGTHSRNENGDAQLNEWILAWVAHTLPRDPGDLFQGNIFYPAKDTLAFSEPLIVPALLGAPVAWLGGSPVLVFNLLVLAGLALSAFAAYVLVQQWTGDRAAALLAGTTWAFNTHTLTRLAHVQGLHIYGLPLVLLAVDNIVTKARIRDALWLAFWVTVLGYTSGYLLVFAALMVGIAVVVRAADWLPRWRRVLALLAAATIGAVLAILPLWIPYHRAATEQGMVRSLESIAEFSATPKGYLASAATVHLSSWSGQFFTHPIDSFFPGIVLIVLAALALISSLRAHTDPKASAAPARRVWMLVAIGVAGFALSLGTRTPVYGWLYHAFPPMQGLRAAARFGNLFLLAISVLGGLGLAVLRRHVRGTRAATVLAVVAVGLANIEALQVPMAYRKFTGIPHLYTLLAAEPRVVLAEVPFYPRQAVFENAEYVLNSTAHWRPLMNGYSGYTPASYTEYANSFWYFPRDYAIDAMKRAGVTHVMVHPARFGPEAPEVISVIEKRGDFEMMGIGPNGLRLYRIH